MWLVQRLRHMSPYSPVPQPLHVILHSCSHSYHFSLVMYCHLLFLSFSWIFQIYAARKTVDSQDSPWSFWYARSVDLDSLRPHRYLSLPLCFDASFRPLNNIPLIIETCWWSLVCLVPRQHIARLCTYRQSLSQMKVVARALLCNNRITQIFFSSDMSAVNLGYE